LRARVVARAETAALDGYFSAGESGGRFHGFDSWRAGCFQSDSSMLGASARVSQDKEQIPRCARDDNRSLNALGIYKPAARASHSPSAA